MFSTKARRPAPLQDIMPELAKVVGGIVRKRGGKLLAMNGTSDHVHLLVVLPAKRALSDMFRDIKAISCNWVHELYPQWRDFAWQSGYGAFSVSSSAAAAVERYILRQAEHHRKMSFEEELLALLKRHGIEHDPRYVLD